MRLLEHRGVVVIAMDVVGMIAGVVANERGMMAGPHGELPLVVEKVSWFHVFVLGHLPLVLL